MTRTRLFSLAAATALAVSACSKDSAPAGSDADNPLLAYAPADTEYVVANLAPPPEEVLNAWLARAEPLLDEIQQMLTQARADLSSGQVDSDDEELVNLALAVIDELDGKINREGLESIGLSMRSYQAIYADELLPVFRVALSDPDALRATIGRVEEKAGMVIPEYVVDDRAYWHIANEEWPVSIALAIVEDHLAASVLPANTAGESTPQLRRLLGLDMPATSFADGDALASLNAENGYTAYGSGYLDTARVVETIYTTGTAPNNLLGYAMGTPVESTDPACRADADRISTAMPRMITGVTELTADSSSNESRIELAPDIAAGLAALVADVPPAADDDSLFASLSLNVNVGRLRAWALERLEAYRANPFGCPALQDLNLSVDQLYTQLNQPVMPFIGNLKGLRLQLADLGDLSGLSTGDFDLANLAGLASLEVESPQMLVGMAKMMIPGFDQLDLEPGGDPVELPQELMTVVTPEFAAHAVMSRDAIGLSFGKDQSGQLVDFLEEDNDPDGVVFSAEYDTASLMELQNSSLEAYAAETGNDTSAELMRAYEAMMGRTRVEVIYDDRGIRFRQHQTFR
ncbi:hypothetical protein F3N42_03400 [Marinihelvus fidelis]|uniref:Uncharacterized protein n=1 Tax=Marinihelvus fidelis TaxID=2613842 RepID=A0A5N0TFZ6_9GAMM|nr:hypothetical protein [Marinihelvus fidelis]KAA9133408.1 hypothetical protein F3N42_03400 [Marinihelvus fidelis]